MRHSAPIVLALLTLLPAVHAQGGGFTAGDLFVYEQSVPGPQDTGIVGIDPFSGAGSVLTTFLTGAIDRQGAIAFDPYRQRLITMAHVPGGSPIWWRPLFVDGAGAVTQLAAFDTMWFGFAPTGDGRIYLYDPTDVGAPLKWLDAGNQFHTLYDIDGVTPYTLDGQSWALEDMLYHPGENALFTLLTHPSVPCPGGNPNFLRVRKLPLTANGTRLAAPTTCGEFDVNPNDIDISRGLHLMSDGDILVGAHSGIYGIPLPRLVRLHPSDVSMTTFASFGDAANNGAGWSSALNRGLAQDHFTARILGYANGQVDDGVPVSTFPFPGTWCVIEEVPTVACDGGWIAWGQGLAGKGGVVPRLVGGGCAEPGSAISLKVDQVVGGASGLLFIGLGATELPFKGGHLYVSPVLLQLGIAVGGAPGAAGAGSFTLPAALPPDPVLHGVSVFLQGAFSDAAAVKGVSLTQGLEMEIG